MSKKSYGNILNPVCCNCQFGTSSTDPTPITQCEFTLYVSDGHGNPTTASVSIATGGVGGLPPTITGNVVDGVYVSPRIPIWADWVVTVTKSCAVATFNVNAQYRPNGCPVYSYCYCEITLNVHVTPTDAFVSVGSSQYVMIETSPGSHVYKSCTLTPCTYPATAPPPAIVSATAEHENYVGACDSAYASCDTVCDITLVLYQFTSCYLSDGRRLGLLPGTPAMLADGSDYANPSYRGLSGFNGVGMLQDNGCTPTAGPDRRGLTPKIIQVTYTPHGTSHGAYTCDYFGTDAGMLFILPMVSNTVISYDSVTGLPTCRIIIWETGCHGGNGNYYCTDDGVIDCYYSLMCGFKRFYGSTKIAIWATCYDTPTVTYRMYISSDCTTGSSYGYDFAFSDMIDLTAVLDQVTYGALSPSTWYSVLVQEAPCS